MKNSNVAINPLVNETLTAFCLKNKLEKKQFIEESLKYFNASGINPAKYESPSAEIEKMHKRIEDIFKFSKAQERDVLKPFIIELMKLVSQNDTEAKQGVSDIKQVVFNRKEQIEKLRIQNSEETNALKLEISDLKRSVANLNTIATKHNSEVERRLKIIIDNQIAGVTGKKTSFS